MTTPPPPGLPGFLRRSIRPALERDSSEADDAVALALTGGPTPPSSGQFRPPPAPPRTPTSRDDGAGGAAAAAAGASESEPTASAAMSPEDIDDEEERLKLEAEREAEAAIAQRVDRRFRFGLTLGGRGKSDGVAAGIPEDDEEEEGLPERPGRLKQRSKSVPSSVGSRSEHSDQGADGEVTGGGSDRGAGPGTPDRSDSSPSLDNRNDGSRKLSYRRLTYERTISAPVVDLRDLRKLSWNGIPPLHRPPAWKMLLGYLPANASRRSAALRRKRAEYRDAIAQHYDVDDDSRTTAEQETLRQVLVDVPRTAPEVGLFRNERIRQILGRLLYIWACRHPASSYVQGINDLATPLIAVFLTEYVRGDEGGKGGGDAAEEDSGEGGDPDSDEAETRLDRVLEGGAAVDDLPDSALAEVEADVYWCLTNLLAGIQDHYTSDQPGVQRMVGRLEELVSRIDADLARHLRDTGVQFLQFAFRWMNCLLLREFNLRCVVRLWDAYLSEEGGRGFEGFHVYVCAAFLCQFSAEVRAMEFDQLFGFMQAMPTADWGDGEVEILLSQAFVLSTLFEGSDAHLAGGGGGGGGR